MCAGPETIVGGSKSAGVTTVVGQTLASRWRCWIGEYSPCGVSQLKKSVVTSGEREVQGHEQRLTSPGRSPRS